MCDDYEGGDKNEVFFNEKKRMEACKKCKGKHGSPAIVIRSDDGPMCSHCFLLACTHKFRSSFGKSQLIRYGEVVLVGYSGGPSSTAMLHLITQGLSLNEHKKLRFRPIIVHIDESELNEASSPQIAENCALSKIEDNLKSSGFEYFIVNFNDALTQLPESAFTKDQLLPASTPLTARESMLSSLRVRILIHLAGQRSCSRLLLAESCSRLAVGLFSGIAQGRGDQVSQQVAFSDNRWGNISVVRPMRELSAKEIAFFNRFNDLDPVVSTNWETKSDVRASIDRLTEDFLAGLQANFPSTVFTVFRTAEKITGESSQSSSTNKCALCQSVITAEKTDSACAERALVESYRLLDREQQIASNLCYACNLIRHETVHPEYLNKFCDNH